MQYVTDLSKYQTENRTAVTLGKFDGLHRGHQELMCGYADHLSVY